MNAPQKMAFGAPGIEPRWTHSDKAGVGTAYSSLSTIWFTLSYGIINEVYFPTIDQPQIRDLMYLLTDGKSFALRERELNHEHEYLAPHALGFRVVTSDPEGRFRLIKEVISTPHRPAVLVHTRVELHPALSGQLKLYALLAPHCGVGGWGNNGHVENSALGKVLVANKDDIWVGLRCSNPFTRGSCGYVGYSDGWQDLAQNFQMDWEFDSAPNGNIALMGEIDLNHGTEFTLCLAFGHSQHHLQANLTHSLAVPYAEHRERFIEQWQRAAVHLLPGKDRVTGDAGHLYQKSFSLILAHEDKMFEGGMIASLSIPWGEAKSDQDLGGYHLVWTRDMCNSATGLLAAGDLGTPLRALIYLACTQRSDGGFYQNFWIDGRPYWNGIQLDESAFPIMLAWRLHQLRALADFDPFATVKRAASYLVLNGPATPQERWEENSGYSPSTLAAHIAGLICAACLARTRGEEDMARFLEEYADFLVANIERWTVTTEGTLVPGITRHFVRINPVDVNDPHAVEDVNHAVLELRNQPPGARTQYPAKEIVDAGFLELVRYGILKPRDSLVEDSLKVVDAVLKVDTPAGPCWRRYNHDGYGQRADGGPFTGYGVGRPWPLLTGERGHYELACGRAVEPYLRAMEAFATKTALLPEQIWDEPDRPEALMFFGKPTGGAMPLLWAHAEYIRLVRSAADGQVFDLLPEVAGRYSGRPLTMPPVMWKFNRQPRSMPAGQTLRVITGAPCLVHWSADNWQSQCDVQARSTGFGPWFVDIPTQRAQKGALNFTFFWTESQQWEGTDFKVDLSS
jgi:glucoamylase